MHRRSLIAALGGALVLPSVALANEEKKKGGGAQFIQIPTITASIMRRDGRRGVITVETGLDVVDNALRTRAELSLPRLRAAFVQYLQTYATSLTGGLAPNADYMAAGLQRQTDTVLGKPGAKLLLGTILMN